MGYGAGAAYGLQRLQDCQLRFKSTTTPVYLRLKQFADVSGTQWAALGFVIEPGSGGTNDVLIDPPPSTETMSLHNIGISGGKLRFGARRFFISATFANAQAELLGLADPYQVWQSAVGLVNENSLYSIEDIQHEEVAGTIINWILICNANELR